jgi:hypothetical protein
MNDIRKDKYNMIRVLTFAPSIVDGTSFYRLGGVLPYLEKEYSDIHIKDLSHKDKLDWHDYTSYDVAVFQRPFIKNHLATINMLKLMGIKVIIDYDDDVLNVPMHNPYYINYDANKETIIDIAKLADHIWLSTNGLKETFKEHNDKITVVPNAHNDYLFPVKSKKNFNKETNIVSYRGGSTHEVDVYSHLDDWTDIINNNLDTEFYFLGARFPYLESKCGDNYLIIPGAHIIDYFYNFKKLNPNIFIYSLEDNTFNRGKSNISWIEATYAGAAVMAPKFLPEFIKPGITNFDDSFKDTFEKLKGDNKTLKVMNELSWDYIKTNLLLSHVNQQRYNTIVELKNRK